MNTEGTRNQRRVCCRCPTGGASKPEYTMARGSQTIRPWRRRLQSSCLSVRPILGFWLQSSERRHGGHLSVGHVIVDTSPTASRAHTDGHSNGILPIWSISSLRKQRSDLLPVRAARRCLPLFAEESQGPWSDHLGCLLGIRRSAFCDSIARSEY